jgi:hypothetical protein
MAKLLLLLLLLQQVRKISLSTDHEAPGLKMLDILGAVPATRIQ